MTSKEFTADDGTSSTATAPFFLATTTSVKKGCTTGILSQRSLYGHANVVASSTGLWTKTKLSLVFTKSTTPMTNPCGDFMGSATLMPSVSSKKSFEKNTTTGGTPGVSDHAWLYSGKQQSEQERLHLPLNPALHLPLHLPLHHHHHLFDFCLVSFVLSPLST